MAGSFIKFTAVLAVALACCGCGGGSAGGGSGSNNEPLEVSVPDTFIDYGDRVTVTWIGEGLQHMDPDRYNGCNFAVGREQTSGSVVDRPATDTTYRLVGVTLDQGNARATVTVRVRPSKKSFLVIGGKSDALSLQVLSELKSITTGPVSFGQRIPSTPVADVLIVLDSGTFDSQEEPRVRSLLANGAKILLAERSVHKLAGLTGPEETDVSNVQSWFGGSRVQNHFGGCDVLNAASRVPLSLVHIGRNEGTGEPQGTVAVTGLEPGVVPLWQDEAGRTTAYVYKPPIGGRIAHLGGLSFGPSQAHAVIRGVFLAECRWLADYE